MKICAKCHDEIPQNDTEFKKDLSFCVRCNKQICSSCYFKSGLVCSECWDDNPCEGEDCVQCYWLNQEPPTPFSCNVCNKNMCYECWDSTGALCWTCWDNFSSKKEKTGSYQLNLQNYS